MASRNRAVKNAADVFAFIRNSGFIGLRQCATRQLPATLQCRLIAELFEATAGNWHANFLGTCERVITNAVASGKRKLLRERNFPIMKASRLKLEFAIGQMQLPLGRLPRWVGT